MTNETATEPIEGVPDSIADGLLYRLDVVSGPNTGSSVTLGKFPVRVGSGHDNDLVLGDGSISRAHFEIRQDGRRLRLVDLQSTNGTLLDRSNIAEAFLRSGELITVGRTIIRFGYAAETSNIVASEAKAMGSLVGHSHCMRQVFSVFERVARTDATVLITGETGTGKELAARAIHEASNRAKRPFIVFDAGAVPESLIESELFGHVKGAFSGADRNRAGLFEAANGGTLFLDEIGELPLHLQPRLLRVLQSQEVKRVGSDKLVKADVRIVAATNRDIRKDAENKRFRKDLYWRLSVVEVAMPALRERPEDIEPIANRFLEVSGSPPLDPQSAAILRGHTWPGNVRQLLNTLERVLALSEDNRIDRDCLHSSLTEFDDLF